MDFSTPCCRKKRPESAVPPVEAAALDCTRRALLCSALLMLYPLSALAEEDAALRLPGGVLMQSEGGELLLSSDAHWQLPAVVEQALRKGVPVHFVAEVHLLRKRWYWSDQVLLTATRYQRLSYQALTRRWRLHTGNQPMDGRLGLGAALGSSYTSLDDAMQALQRLVRWRIGARSELPAQGDVTLQLRFRIDLKNLPRPLQIGALGRSDWNLLFEQEDVLPLEQL